MRTKTSTVNNVGTCHLWGNVATRFWVNVNARTMERGEFGMFRRLFNANLTRPVGQITRPQEPSAGITQ